MIGAYPLEPGLVHGGIESVTSTLVPALAEAHAALTESYAVREDYGAAWRHARLAEQHGEARGVELLRRYGVAEL